MQRNYSASIIDQQTSNMQPAFKNTQNQSSLLSYDFIDPSEDYHSAGDKENSLHQHSLPQNPNLYSSLTHKEPLGSKYNSGVRGSPVKVADESGRIRSVTPPYLDYQSTTGIRSQNYSPLANSRASVKRSPPRKGSNEMSNTLYESSGQKKVNLGTSSVQVMRKVFDEDYSLSSPNRKGRRDDDEEDEQAEYQKERSNTLQKSTKNNRSQEVNFEFLDEAYQIFLNKLKVNPKMNNATIDDYISESIEYLKHPDQHMRIGAIINLFDILYYNASAILPTHAEQISDQIFTLLPHFHNSEDFYFVYLTLEVLHLLGPNDVVYNNIKTLLVVLTDERFPKAQERAFKVLTNLDYPGLYALFDLASKDFDEIPFFVLNLLAQFPEIQARIIVPALLNDLASSDNKKRTASLAALNRMFAMVKYGGGLPVLISLLQDGSLDRQLVASTILATGPIGEQTLIKILRTTNNAKIKQAICNVLPWRLSGHNQLKLVIDIIPYQVSQHYNLNPGTMCIYQGDLRPLSQVEIQQEVQDISENRIEINSRDFLASVHRYITLKYQDFAFRDKTSLPHDHDELKNFNDFNSFLLVKFLKNEPEKNLEEDIETQHPPVSSNLIKVLISLYGDKDATVRETCINSLGIIGLPEAAEALETLVQALSDRESQIRAVAAWAIGKLGDLAAHKASKRLVELLKDSFWKVRTSACIALGCMGDVVGPSLHSILVKCLKDGSINKVVVCETLVRLGQRGEQILIDILKKVPNINYSLKAAIIQSLELADADSPSIDFVIEELFRNAADPMIQVRKACLITLERLRMKSQANNITYLKSKNILPLFYYFLQDPAQEMRTMALQSIYSFGPQGELMLIEGLAKDKNPVIRGECAKGLGLFGPHTFRAIIFGLRDPEEGVRMATSLALKKNFTAEDVINTFIDKHHQMPAIVCSIREILNLNYFYHKSTKQYLEKILAYFQDEINNNRSRMDTHLTTSISRGPEGFYSSAEYEDRPLQYNYEQQEAEYNAHAHNGPIAQFGQAETESGPLRVEDY